MFDWCVEPFLHYGFMRHALAGCLLIAIGGAPVGVFLTLRHMSLVGDAMAHALLPGVATAYLIAGLSLSALTLGGIVGGTVVALGSSLVTRRLSIAEAESFAAFYLIALASGVLIMSLGGSSNVDLNHVLFGSVLAIDQPMLQLMFAIATATVLALALLYRPLVLECVDAQFLRTVSNLSPVVHHLFLVLVVVNLVAGFQALGTLMAIGLMILPAVTARLWAQRLESIIAVAVAIAMGGSGIGLVVSYHLGTPSGPTIVLAIGAVHLFSLVFATRGLLARRLQEAGSSMTRHARRSMIRLPVLFLAASLATASHDTEAAAETHAVDVVATFSVLGDWVRVIGGDRVSLSTLVGPDSDAHVYEPSPADAARLAHADLLIVNGLGFEGWLDRLIRASGTHAHQVVASDGIQPRRNARGTPDPHAWHDIDNAIHYVGQIEAGLCKVDAEGCPLYKSNAQAYVDELRSLDAQLKAQVNRIPISQRVVVTPHDAFEYLGAAFGIRFLAPLGLSTESDASALDIAAIVESIRGLNANALFIENIADPRVIEQIARESNLPSGGTLYGDALSSSNGPAPTYVAMMRHNVATIVAALSARHPGT